MNQGARRLKEYIIKRDITQGAMATTIDTTDANLSRIINGLQMPSIEIAVKISKATDGYVIPEDFTRDGDNASNGTAA